MKLCDLKEIYKNIQMLIDNEDASVDDMKLALTQLEDDIQNKADSIAFILNDIKSDIDKFKSFEQKFYDKRKSLENKMNSLKMYLENTLIDLDMKKFKTDYFSFNIQKNIPSLDIVNEDNIPDEFYKLQRTLDKKQLLDAIKNGTVIDGVRIKQSESLRIK